ncbi:MAG: glutamine synthetase type [Bacteriovoracaceae bacterium]|nr:glutamine synthetase type [Bacteriovoracaceae bacterium]
MSARRDAIIASISRQPRKILRPTDLDGKPLVVSQYFGSLTFGLDQMKSKLSKDSYQALLAMVNRGTRLTKEVSDEIANVVKDWAISQGAGHFCHWFQPMTGLTAEKHDSFIQTRTSETGQTQSLERFTGSALIQSEPDASSFPSGGMRSTFEARGYTAWDPTSPLFIIESTNGKTLCIPSAFLSYHGHALDTKTPLVRSTEALSKQATKFLKLLGDVDITSVFSTLGAEQEYFLIDRAQFSLRPDLLMTGRTLLGRGSTRGQQFEDHYFGSIPSRVLAFMQEIEQELYKLGVPIKTRHNEVAPAQFELAPVFEESNLSCDHNSLVMDILCRVALRHDLVCLLHEKPFAGINGSGKHNNWSLSTQKGENLLEPGKTPHQNLRFLAVLVAVIKAVHDHADVLRIGIASPGNDHRLGANEAPPAIISTFLGESLSGILNKIEAGALIESPSEEAILSLGVSRLPVVARDNTDRNRTSPFAFTGNKFEFRAVGSSANCAVPISILNAAAADSFSLLTERLEKKLAQTKSRDEAVLSLIREVIKETKNVRFEGNNYSAEWKAEAAKRGLPNHMTTPEALAVFHDKKATEFLVKQQVLSADEINARHNIMVERYIKQIEMEAATLLELVQTHVYPAVEGQISKTAQMVGYVKEAGKSISTDRLQDINALYEKLLKAGASLQTEYTKALDSKDEHQKSTLLSEKVLPAMNKVRDLADEAEGLVADELWPLPKYREILFLK